MELQLADHLAARRGTDDADVATARELEQTLRRLIDAAHERWPGIDVDDVAFVDHLADRLDPDAPITARAVEALCTDDLYLALACALGSPVAIEAFRRSFAVELAHVFARPSSGGIGGDDLQQAFFERLFLGRGELPPRILSYAGVGSLRAWVRVSAARLRLNAERGLRPAMVDLQDGGVADAVTAVTDDAELAYLRARYRPAFSQAFAQAVAALTPKQRNLLRLNILRGISGTRIAELYGVHRATAKRWLAAARSDLVVRTRDQLKGELGLDTHELSSLMQLVASNLEISVARHLQTRPP
jgi:RNA polymerase sigma-70 factor (ECF subfamily)